MTPDFLVALPPLRPEEEIKLALSSDVVAERILGKNAGPKKGELIGVRLNLNVLKNTGVAVQTLHAGTNVRGYTKNRGFFHGEAVGYAEAVVLRQAYFNVSQSGREAIAIGQSHKFPMASVDGTLVGHVPEEGFLGMPIRFNPKTSHLFTDPDGFAVHGAEEVVIVGHRAYARGRISYHTMETAPKRAGDAPTLAQLRSPLDAELQVPTSDAQGAVRPRLGKMG